MTLAEFLSTSNEMVDVELGTQRFIFNFWADATRSYCNSSLHFVMSLLFKRAKCVYGDCTSIQSSYKIEIQPLWEIQEGKLELHGFEIQLRDIFIVVCTLTNGFHPQKEISLYTYLCYLKT